MLPSAIARFLASRANAAARIRHCLSFWVAAHGKIGDSRISSVRADSARLTLLHRERERRRTLLHR